jgi:mRNA interferase RelE/StbE
MDGATRRLVLAYIDKHLNDCDDPRAVGKALAGNLSGKWRYRVGSYRILAIIEDERLIIQIFKIGDRKNIYGT